MRGGAQQHVKTTENALFGEDWGWLGIVILLKYMKEYCLEGEIGLFLNDHKNG